MIFFEYVEESGSIHVVCLTFIVGCLIRLFIIRCISVKRVFVEFDELFLGSKVQ